MIRAENVSKRFGSTLAVDSVSFSIAAGEVVGFLGPNGAGKSTLLRMISTWLPPTSGTLEVAGHDVVREALAVRRAIGYLPEHNSLWDTMRVEGLLRFVGRVRGLAGARLAERIGWAVERCGLQEAAGKRVRECSKGFRQRLGVAVALLHDPPVLLLDEPTHGLDPLQVAAFLDFVRDLAADRAVLFSSHVLSEVVAVSERLLVIDHGRLVFDGPLSRLEERASRGAQALEALVLDLVRAGRGSRG